ncbi:radical SAM protein [Pyrofollis japonicus]|uniref:B12-binding domain-containing radical SAM protein n=1 Tax=Pyrofollis japonicus TaxID=3060460 RepID=UPI00295AABFF|nr:radical SAM protein [Pyrofollis japonicus]BEP18191.1 radical SAM protein [Pyrofollis japonicus]
MDVLMVDALGTSSYGKRQVTIDVIGAGPRTVVGVLEKNGINADLVTSDYVIKNKHIVKNYDVLMISAMSVDIETVRRIIKLWKRDYPYKPVIVGGPIALDPNSITYTGADVAIHGESEPVIGQIFSEEIISNRGIDYERLSKVCGVAYFDRHSGNIRVNSRCPIMPRRIWEQYRPSTRIIRSYPFYWAARVYVEVVRGCSNYNFPNMEEILPKNLLPSKPKPGCAYCSVIHLWGYARSRSISLVYDEVKALIDEGVRRIVLSGPDFLDYGRDWLVEPRPLVNPYKPPPNTEAIEGLLKRLHSIPEVANGEVSIMVENAKPNLVTDEVARILGKYLRGTPIHIGAEVGNDKLLKLLGRPALTHDVYRAVKLLKQYGLRPYVYVMYCLPGENEEVIQQTVQYMERLYRLGAEKITAYKFMPLPGSYLEKLVGHEIHCRSPHPVKLKSIEINKKAKRRLIGQVVKAIVVNKSKRFRGYIAYPLSHGPVIVIRLGKGLRPGCLIKARITDIISDRVVEATILERIKCYELYSWPH